MAQTVLQPPVQAAEIIRRYSEDQLDLDAVVVELTSQAQATSGGDLSRAEAMLIAQAHALDAIFARMALLAAPRAGESLDACETYLRLASKAQSQCRATLETLGTLTNPSPALFVRQQNIGVNQQVNNLALDAAAEQPNSAHWSYIMANGWTPQRRARQAKLIQHWRPWERSTGAKTKQGKG